MNEVRSDKWMWATRIFKTRTIAADACKKKRVLVGGMSVKPSRMIRTGEVIAVHKPPVTYSFRVLGLTGNRMAAKLVPQYLANITPPEEYELLELSKISGFVNRAKGLGRPTKKERRDLEQFADAPTIEITYDWDEDWDEDISMNQ
jgi:ribosome-associated heat shock protein Hsp15